VDETRALFSRRIDAMIAHKSEKQYKYYISAILYLLLLYTSPTGSISVGKSLRKNISFVAVRAHMRLDLARSFDYYFALTGDGVADKRKKKETSAD